MACKLSKVQVLIVEAMTRSKNNLLVSTFEWNKDISVKSKQIFNCFHLLRICESFCVLSIHILYEWIINRTLKRMCFSQLTNDWSISSQVDHEHGEALARWHFTASRQPGGPAPPASWPPSTPWRGGTALLHDLRRQGHGTPLRDHYLWRVQGVLQEDCPEQKVN